ncbi:alpha/beta hydrolase [Kitasatospora herbaricolor]|uniref:Lysophospholipase n=1 Tax=Kitasatospora herbaricolor TaxID=68217 RepID=A0ABZ1W0D1_9ACTN|nr:alpha/beta fold hydrolase [Kitasatospora herbaricolor]
MSAPVAQAAIAPAAPAPVPAAAAPGPRPGMLVWEPAEGAARRGTVVLLPGRGESPAVYQRFGRRLAADGYGVHVLALGPEPAPAEVAAAFAAVAGQAPAPVVLAGSDTGALRALAAAREAGARPDGLVLAALPLTDDTPPPGDWEEELAARTSCPAHRGVLTADPAFGRGRFADRVPDALLAPALNPAAAEAAAPVAAGPLPVLVLHGAADPVAPPQAVREFAAGLPAAVLVLVEDGRHDVLNDATHRSVAAQLVQWLERLRGGPDLPRLLTVEEPAR